MIGITEEQIENVWKVRDICQEVSSSLEVLSEEESIEQGDKSLLLNDCEVVRKNIEEMSALGYFGKKTVSPKTIVELVNKIIEIENKDSAVVAKLWQKQITNVTKVKQDNFKLCVKPFFGQIRNNILATMCKKDPFVSARLISNKNMYMPCNSILGEKDDKLIAGLIYPVSEDNFVAATDCSSNIVIKDTSDVTDRDFVPTAKSEDKCLFVNGFATKLKSPSEIIKKYSNNRFFDNNNAVVLCGDTMPCGVFCQTHTCKFASPEYAEAKAVAQELGLPLVELSAEQYLNNNKKYFASNSEGRTVFNHYIDVVARDLKDYCGCDIFGELKKLKGFNTNLRYNYFYKFINGLTKHFEQSDIDDKKGFVVKAIKKSVEKRNALQMEREKENGGTLVYPTENIFIPLPAEFLQ